MPQAGKTPPGAWVERSSRCARRSRSSSTRPSASNGVTGKKRMPSKSMPARPFESEGSPRSGSSSRQWCAGRQPSSRRGLGGGEGGAVPVSPAARASVPGTNLGSSSASGSRARASSAPTKKTSPFGIESAGRRAGASTKVGDVARVDVVEERRRRRAPDRRAARRRCGPAGSARPPTPRGRSRSRGGRPRSASRRPSAARASRRSARRGASTARRRSTASAACPRRAGSARASSRRARRSRSRSGCEAATIFGMPAATPADSTFSASVAFVRRMTSSGALNGTAIAARCTSASAGRPRSRGTRHPHR